MAQQPLEILIKKSDGATGGASDNVGESPTTASPKKPAERTDRTAQLVLARVMALGKEAINVGLDKHVAWTGDSVVANKIKRAMSIGTTALTIYLGGWIGVGYTAGKEILGFYGEIKDLQIERRKLDYNKERLGRVVNK